MKMETLKMPRDINPKDLGIHILVHSERPMVDIVAVHGLGATPSTTWTKAPKLQDPTQTNKFEDRINWLSNPTMLPKIVTNARIMTFNYDSNWYGEEAVKARLDNIANALRRKVSRQRKDCPSRPLLFIGHCFGGLVIEKALIQPQMSKILDVTKGVVLLGTPHRGTDKVTSGELLQRIIRAGIAGESASLAVLQADNEMVSDVVHSFSTITREKHIPVHCFFEQRSSKVAKMFGDNYKDFIVDEKSAILDGCESYGLPLDHYQLNKFSDPMDGNWIELADVISDLCEEAAKNDLEPEATTRTQNLTPPGAGVGFSGSNTTTMPSIIWLEEKRHSVEGHVYSGTLWFDGEKIWSRHCHGNTFALGEALSRIDSRFKMCFTKKSKTIEGHTKTISIKFKGETILDHLSTHNNMYELVISVTAILVKWGL